MFAVWGHVPRFVAAAFAEPSDAWRGFVAASRGSAANPRVVRCRRAAGARLGSGRSGASMRQRRRRGSLIQHLQMARTFVPARRRWSLRFRTASVPQQKVALNVCEGRAWVVWHYRPLLTPTGLPPSRARPLLESSRTVVSLEVHDCRSLAAVLAQVHCPRGCSALFAGATVFKYL